MIFFADLLPINNALLEFTPSNQISKPDQLQIHEISIKLVFIKWHEIRTKLTKITLTFLNNYAFFRQ